MITRTRARRGALWAGAAIGAAGVLLYLMSLVVSIRHVSMGQSVLVGGGALVGNGAAVGGPVGWTIEWGPARWWYLLPRWRSQPGGPDWIVLPGWVLIALGLVCGYFLLPKDPAPGHCP